MAAGASLRQIAEDQRVTYQTAARWAKRYRWRVIRKANRTLGIPALFDYKAVQADLAEREAA